MSSAIATASLLPSPAPRRHLEDDLQRAVIQYLGLALGSRGVAYAIPNGGRRHAREAARMKGLGVRAGMPDIGICVDGGKALFVELKAPRGVMSDAQKDMARRLTYLGAAGHAVPIGRGCGGAAPRGVRPAAGFGGGMKAGRPRTLTDRPCAGCGGTFRPKHATQRFCCRACRGRTPVARPRYAYAGRLSD